jgi:hypothetical protein
MQSDTHWLQAEVLHLSCRQQSNEHRQGTLLGAHWLCAIASGLNAAVAVAKTRMVSNRLDVNMAIHSCWDVRFAPHLEAGTRTPATIICPAAVSLSTQVPHISCTCAKSECASRKHWHTGYASSRSDRHHTHGRSEGVRRRHHSRHTRGDISDSCPPQLRPAGLCRCRRAANSRNSHRIALAPSRPQK